MSITELEELLWLKRWSKRRLAAELSMSENAIYRWFIDRRPSAAASALMRGWLEESRLQNELTFTKAERKKLADARALLARGPRQPVTS